MKFFVPYHDAAESERIWAAVRAALREIGYPTTERRIQALSLGAREHILAVGMTVPAGEALLLILEASGGGTFYACTPSHGVDEGVPLELGLTRHGRVIDFDPAEAAQVTRPARLH